MDDDTSNGNPAQERLAKRRARRELEFQEQIRAHDGTGFPPDIDFDDSNAVIEATLAGQCLKCSGKWGPLRLHVWKHYPGMTPKEGIRAYRNEFHIPDNVQIASDKYLKQMHDGRNTHLAGPAGKATKTQIATTLSRPRPEMYGRTGRNPSGWNPSDWDIAKCLSSGMGQAETAKKLGGKGNHKLIGRRAESMDLARDTSFFCDCGEFYLNGSLFGLRKLSGFEANDFDRITGLSEGRSQATRPADSIANPDDAGKVIEWRDGVIRELLKVSAESHCRLRLGEKVYSQERVLKTFLPKLPTLNEALVDGEISRSGA